MYCENIKKTPYFLINIQYKKRQGNKKNEMISIRLQEPI